MIKYFGAGAMVFAFLIVTPYHDVMLTISSVLVLVSMFYITVFVLRSRLQFIKILCIVCLLFIYCCNYMYYTRSYMEVLPVMQKVGIFIALACILTLQYFTTMDDFGRDKAPVSKI